MLGPNQQLIRVKLDIINTASNVGFSTGIKTLWFTCYANVIKTFGFHFIDRKIKFPDTLQTRTLSWGDLFRDLARILLLH